MNRQYNAKLTNKKLYSNMTRRHEVYSEVKGKFSQIYKEQKILIPNHERELKITIKYFLFSLKNPIKG